MKPLLLFTCLFLVLILWVSLSAPSLLSLFSGDKSPYQVSRYPVARENRGEGASHSRSSAVIPLLPGNLLGCEGLMWEDWISGRDPVPPFPSCTGAVTCDCISPHMTELAWQRSPPAGLIIELRVIFYQHVWVAKEGWWQQGIVIGPDAEQQRKVYRNSDGVLCTWGAAGLAC